MRVISGSAKGHTLKSPGHLKLRPTPARVKEALFSSLATRIGSAQVLELFAGTGAFGIETLSQGASSVIFVEKDPRAKRLIIENLEATHLSASARILQMDVFQALERLSREEANFDIIFADPPYDKSPSSQLQSGFKKNAFSGKSKEAPSWFHRLLQASALSKLLKGDGVLLIEHYKKEPPIHSPYFQLSREFCFGDTIVGVYQHSDLKKENVTHPLT